ncbi:MAG: peptidoglycan-binding domain-containing protein [Cyanobacteria bacterium P01_D01_bin.2]
MANSVFEKSIQSLEPDPLQLGDRGWAVEQLQIVLHTLNLYVDTPDGYFGPATQRAVELFQAQSELPVTGQFNSVTWYALSFWTLPPTVKAVRFSSRLSWMQLFQSIVRLLQV